MTSQENKGCCPSCRNITGSVDSGMPTCLNPKCPDCHLPPNETSEWEAVLRDNLEWLMNGQPHDRGDLVVAEEAILTAHRAALLRQKASIREMVALKFKAGGYEKYCDCDGQCFAACKASWNAAIADIVTELGIEK